MRPFSFKHVALEGVVSVVPSSIAYNEDLPHLSQEDKTHLISTTGIKQRRIAPPNITASDLGLCAAKELLKKLRWELDDVELLVNITQTPDYLLPGNSILIQSKLGLPSSTLCLDINQGCAGYIYGLSLVFGLMSTGHFRKAILIASDTITHTIGKNDFSLLPIFSDAGTATAIQYQPDLNDDSWFCVDTDGSHFDTIFIPDGGGRNPVTTSSFIESSIDNRSSRSLLNLHMNGQDVFHFGLKYVATQIQQFIHEIGIDKNTIDYWIFHQANKLLNERIASKLSLPDDKVLYSLDTYGNTSCATIPVTICHHHQRFEQLSNRVLLSGFGVGFSWASACLNIRPSVCSPIIEYYE